MSGPAAPRAQGWLVGHEAAERTLTGDARAERLHHAWLLTGPPGIGKATLAFRFARWMLAGQPTGGMAVPDDHPVARRIAAGTHADLLSVARGRDEKRQRLRDEIVADDVRPIGGFLRRTAAEGGWRVVILDDADLMNRNAANALLKVLEEPPAHAVLILVSSVPGRLLPTIRSRCRILRLEPLGLPQMMAALSGLLSDADEPALRRLALLGQGAPGRALMLGQEDGLVLDELVRQVLDHPPSAGQAYAVADVILRREGGFPTFLMLLANAISAILRDRARNGRSMPPGPACGIDWMSVWQQIGRLRDETDRFNLDKRQALLLTLSLLGG